MNEKKIKSLFASARKESAPVPPMEFATDVLRAVRREPPSTPRPFSIFDQLNFLFPRLAVAAVALIVLCIAADFGLTSAGLPEVGDGATQVSAQFLFFDVEDL